MRIIKNTFFFVYNLLICKNKAYMLIFIEQFHGLFNFSWHPLVIVIQESNIFAISLDNPSVPGIICSVLGNLHIFNVIPQLQDF